MITNWIDALPANADIERLEEGLNAIHEIARAVLVPSDRITLCRTIFHSLRRVFTIDAGFMDWYDPATDTLESLYRFDEGVEDIAFEPWDYRTSRTVSWVVEHRRPLVFADLHRELPDMFPGGVKPAQFGQTERRSRSWMTVPLLLTGRLVGMINLQSYEEDSYGELGLHLLQLLSNTVAVALENSRLIKTLEDAVGELEIPIIPLIDGLLVIPLVDVLDQPHWEVLTERALSAVQERQASGLLLDASGLLHFDLQTLQSLSRLSGAVKLMGAKTVLIGMRPLLIQGLVDARLDLEGIPTARDLTGGLVSLRRLLA